MKHSLLSVILLTLVSFSAYAQVEDDGPEVVETRFIMPLNYTIIKELAQNEEEFGKLLARFEAADPDLGIFDVAMLYYGMAFRPAYKGNLDAENSPVESLVYEGRNADAWKAGVEYLKTNPVSLITIQHMIAAGTEAGKSAKEIDRLKWKFDMLMRTIFYSGDGLTEETAFKTISKSDEFIFMDNMLGIKKHGPSIFLPTYATRYEVLSAENFDRRWLFMDSSLANHFGPAWEPKEIVKDTTESK